MNEYKWSIIFGIFWLFNKAAKNLLMDTFAKSTVRCDDPQCVEARYYCLSITREEIELLDTLYTRHVDAMNAAKIYLDYRKKSSYTTIATFLKEYTRKEKQKKATGNNVCPQEDDFLDTLQNLAYVDIGSGPTTSKKATKKKTIRGRQTQLSPSSIRIETNKVELTKLTQPSIPTTKKAEPFVRIPIGVSGFAQCRGVEKWKKKNIQQLLDHFKNVDEHSTDYQYKNINSTEERIKIEKRRHDLFPVEDVLVQSDVDQYFVCNAFQSQYGLIHAYMAKAILEYQEGREKKTKTGMVDILVSPDKKKIFHKMFREDKNLENTLKCSMPAEEQINDDQCDDQDFIVVPDRRTGTTRSLLKDPNNNCYIIEFLYEETEDLRKTLFILPYK